MSSLVGVKPSIGPCILMVFNDNTGINKILGRLELPAKGIKKKTLTWVYSIGSFWSKTNYLIRTYGRHLLGGLLTSKSCNFYHRPKNAMSTNYFFQRKLQPPLKYFTYQTSC